MLDLLAAAVVVQLAAWGALLIILIVMANGRASRLLFAYHVLLFPLDGAYIFLGRFVLRDRRLIVVLGVGVRRVVLIVIEVISCVVVLIAVQGWLWLD